MDSRAVVQAAVVTPPRAVTGNAAPHGYAVAIQLVAGAAAVLSLRQLVHIALSPDTGTYSSRYEVGSAVAMLGSGAPAAGPGGAVGSWITISPEGADVGIVTGGALADVTGGNAPVLAAKGAIDGNGVYTPTPGVCWRIRDQLVAPSPISDRRFKLMTGRDELLGFVPSANGVLRLYISSEAALRT